MKAMYEIQSPTDVLLKQPSCIIHPREAMLRPVAGVCNIAEEQRRNNA